MLKGCQDVEETCSGSQRERREGKERGRKDKKMRTTGAGGSLGAYTVSALGHHAEFERDVREPGALRGSEGLVGKEHCVFTSSTGQAGPEMSVL